MASNVVHLLFDLVPGHAVPITTTLARMGGVMRADFVPGPPDLVVTLVAPDVKSLVDVTGDIVDALEPWTIQYRCLPVQRGVSLAKPAAA